MFLWFAGFGYSMALKTLICEEVEYDSWVSCGRYFGDEDNRMRDDLSVAVARKRFEFHCFVYC